LLKKGKPINKWRDGKNKKSAKELINWGKNPSIFSDSYKSPFAPRFFNSRYLALNFRHKTRIFGL